MLIGMVPNFYAVFINVKCVPNLHASFNDKEYYLNIVIGP